MLYFRGNSYVSMILLRDANHISMKILRDVISFFFRDMIYDLIQEYSF